MKKYQDVIKNTMRRGDKEPEQTVQGSDTYKKENIQLR